MNRTIKFRALKDDMSNCNFLYGSLLYNSEGIPFIDEGGDDILVSSCLKGSEGQFTGLLDSLGVEIYEGDIVSCKVCVEPFTTEVIWKNGGFTYQNTFYDYDGLLYPHEWEVVGNIHETK